MSKPSCSSPPTLKSSRKTTTIYLYHLHVHMLACWVHAASVRINSKCCLFLFSVYYVA
jgi:hypothetical protein